MATQHNPAFLALVEKSRARIPEIPAEVLQERLKQTPGAVLLDVREESEFRAGHLIGAVHLSRGVLERDIETLIPDLTTPLFLYCGGGYRSALATDSLQQMGYTKAVSVEGGWRALQNMMPVASGG